MKKKKTSARGSEKTNVDKEKTNRHASIGYKDITYSTRKQKGKEIIHNKQQARQHYNKHISAHTHMELVEV